MCDRLDTRSESGPTRGESNRSHIGQTVVNQDLENYIRPIVRRVIRTRCDTSLLARHILAAAEGIAATQSGEAVFNREELVTLVSRRVSEMITPQVLSSTHTNMRMLDTTMWAVTTGGSRQ